MGNMSSNKDEVTVPRNSMPIAGIPYRDNKDGTITYFPPTTVAFFAPSNYETMKKKLPVDEVALIEKNIIEGDYDKKRDSEGLPKADPGWARACDLHSSIKQSHDKEYLFVATHHFQKRDTVGVAHMKLSQKSVCVAESFPARISVSQSITMDVCRGQSQATLCKLLSKAVEFFEGWASFQVQLAKAEHGGGLDRLSCSYKLRLPVAATEETKADGGSWFRPTEKMCQAWGYEKKEQKWPGSKDGETMIILSEIPKPRSA